MPRWLQQLAFVWCAGLLSLAATGCVGRPSARKPEGATAVYIVRAGDTMAKIGRKFEVEVETLAKMNRLDDPRRIYPGQRLWIPAVARSQPRPRATDETALASMTRDGRDSGYDGAQRLVQQKKDKAAKRDQRSTDRGAETRQLKRGKQIAQVTTPAPPRPANSNAKLQWPTQGVLYSKFGLRDGRKHDGIDISAPEGSPVVAAGPGRVIYSGTEKGYGNLVLIEHDDMLITVYAHNRKNHVETGDRVRAGEKIAEVGATGKASGTHLHFEVRVDTRAVDPLGFLP